MGRYQRLFDQLQKIVLPPRIYLKIAVIKHFTEQEVAFAAAAHLFHHVNVTVAVGIQVIGRITRIFNKGPAGPQKFDLFNKAPLTYE